MPSNPVAPFCAPGQLPPTVEALEAVEASEKSRQEAHAREVERVQAAHFKARGDQWKAWRRIK